MLRLELVEENILSGDYGYGGDYGGSGSLVLNDYLPERVAAQTGELWLSFINEPAKKPFKVADVAAGQKVQIPFIADTPIRLYLVSHDPTGHRTTTLQNAVTKDLNINREINVPVIEQIGQSTLSRVIVGVKNFTPAVKYRKIQRSADIDFTFPVQDIHDFYDVVTPLTAIENVDRPFSETPETIYYRVAHSTNGTYYTDWSNVLAITFENTNNNGVPVLSTDPVVVTNVGNVRFVKFPLPTANGFSIKRLQVRDLSLASNTKANGAQPASATTINLDDASGFNPAGGRGYIDATQETFRYTGISGNSLIGVTRGVEISTAANIPDDADVFDVIYYEEIANPPSLVPLPRLQVNSLLNYRLGNDYFNTGQEGLAAWLYAAFCVGTIAEPTPAPYVPPAVPPEDPPIVGENPFDSSNDKGRRPDYFELSTV